MKVRTDLVAGRNVILTGAYGIGRTSLLRHMARSMARNWRFVFLDGSRTGGRVCVDLFAALFPHASDGGPSTLPYRWARHRIVTRPPEDPRSHVLVLDDLARVSAAKLDLVRRLVRAGRFRLVAVPEAFLPPAKLSRLQAALQAGAPLRLRPLRLDDAEQFFREGAWTLETTWSRARIHGLAVASRGFPLGMKQLLVSELNGREHGLNPHVDGDLDESRKEVTP